MRIGNERDFRFCSSCLCNARRNNRRTNRMQRAGRLLTTRLAITVVPTLLVLGFTTHRAAPQQAAPQVDPAASVGWDREGAARYLDDRMQVWFANAKKLR